MPSMPSPLPPSLWSDTARRIGAGVALLAVAAIGFGAGWLVFGDSGSEDTATVAVGGSKGGPAFPEAATRNTTRVGGADTIEDAASVALATYPSAGGVGAAPAVTIAPDDNWQQALAAAPLVADPIGTPILLSTSTEVPAPTDDALAALAPKGIAKANGTQAYVVGDVAVPDGLKQSPVAGTDPADIADAIDGERAKITGEKDPAHLLVVSSADAALAMPAAAWAARSGDPILFADGDTVPEGTANVIARHPDTPVYVLGPESAISDKALKELGDATRVGSEDPVDNAITFARFTDGDFGWNINDPGHGFAIANVDRPLDAPAAAPLAATGGSPGPLLLTDESESVPPALESFLSDTQPGFEDDPTRAVFNHVWIIGDTGAMSLAFQAQVDQLTKLAPVSTSATPPGVTVPEDAGSTTGSTTTGETTTIPDLGALGGDSTATTPETTTTSVPDLSIPGDAGGDAGN
ncbi:MAG: cell wall-binding repeat-containing protein [Solirubrobacterales bacterium]|nr:cell wall-binding repeat-containing protein [Solirubrobacterales bacterium]